MEGDVDLEEGEEVDEGGEAGVATVGEEVVEGGEAELAFGTADELGAVDMQIGHTIVEEVGEEAGGREVGVAGGDLMGYGRLPVGVDGDGHDGECNKLQEARISLLLKENSMYY